MDFTNLMISDYVREVIEVMGEDMYYIYKRIKEERPETTSKWKLRFWINFNKKGILVINFFLETDTDKDVLLSSEAPIGHWAFVN